MNRRSFDDIPDHARLWAFAAPRPLTEAEEESLLRRVDDFVAQWKAHDHPVVGAREWRDHQFLLVAADEQATGVSGCSIDSLFHVLKDSERELGVSLLDSSLVWFRNGEGTVRSLSRADFRKLAEAGEVDGDTPVFDNTVSSVGALRAGEWERPLHESWHAKAFPIAVERA